jgi:hypothetical protein
MKTTNDKKNTVDKKALQQSISEKSKVLKHNKIVKK